MSRLEVLVWSVLAKTDLDTVTDKFNSNVMSSKKLKQHKLLESYSWTKLNKMLVEWHWVSIPRKFKSTEKTTVTTLLRVIPWLALELLLLLLHPFNGLFSRITWVSQYQKGKTSLDLHEARWGLGMQWHQLDHMQTICTSLQTDNHTKTPSLNFYRPDALPDTQPTASKHWRH